MIKKQVKRNQEYAYCERITYRSGWYHYDPERHGEAQRAKVTSLTSSEWGGVQVQLPDGSTRDVPCNSLLDTWDNYLSWVAQHRSADETRANLERLIEEVKALVGEGEDYWSWRIDGQGRHNEPCSVTVSFPQFVQLAELALRAGREQTLATSGLDALIA